MRRIDGPADGSSNSAEAADGCIGKREFHVLICRLERYAEMGGKLDEDTDGVSTALRPQPSPLPDNNNASGSGAAPIELISAGGTLLARLAPMVSRYLPVSVPLEPHTEKATFMRESATVWPMAWIPRSGQLTGPVDKLPRLSAAEQRYFMKGMMLAIEQAQLGKQAGYQPSGCAILLPRLNPANNNNGDYADGGDEINANDSAAIDCDGDDDEGELPFLVRGAGYGRIVPLGWNSSSADSAASSSSLLPLPSKTTNPLHSAAMMAIDDVAEWDRQLSRAASSSSSSDSSGHVHGDGTCAGQGQPQPKGRRDDTPMDRIPGSWGTKLSGCRPQNMTDRLDGASVDCSRSQAPPASTSADDNSDQSNNSCAKRPKLDNLAELQPRVQASNAASGIVINSDGVAIWQPPTTTGGRGSAGTAAPTASGSAAAGAGDAEGAATEPTGQQLYICTGCDAFLTHEPSMLDAMALLHSRVGRLIYGVPDDHFGAVGGTRPGAPPDRPTIRLQEIRALNHHYKVWRMHGLVEEQLK